MNIKTKNILKWIIGIVSIVILGYTILVGFVIYSFSSGCGMDDGPFKALRINEIDNLNYSNKLELSGNGQLIIDNRLDSLSPIIVLLEEGNTIWSLDTDTRNTEGYESTEIWQISKVSIVEDSKSSIQLKFVGHWTYGAERGSMKIDRKTGENSFCLSW